MRRLCVTTLGLALLVPVLRGAEQKDDKAAPAQAPAAQFRELSKAFHDQMTDLSKQYAAAKADADKAKIRAKALREVPAEYGQKMLALATAHPKDPVAVDALIWVCTQATQSPHAPQALDAL